MNDKNNRKKYPFNFQILSMQLSLNNLFELIIKRDKENSFNINDLTFSKDMDVIKRVTKMNVDEQFFLNSFSLMSSSSIKKVVKMDCDVASVSLFETETESL